jgi:hypothetical protein
MEGGNDGALWKEKINSNVRLVEAASHFAVAG